LTCGFTEIVHRVVAHPAIYDLVQRLAGRETNLRRLAPTLSVAAGGLLLDVGAGTGEGARAAPPSARYLWLDRDPRKLAGFAAKKRPGLAVVGDAARIGLRDKSVDVALCMAMSHHLSDAELDALLGEVARVCRKRFVFLDALDAPASLLSRVLWRYDRGSYPRRPEALLGALRERFEIDHVERYATLHQFLLCSGSPRPSR
jgi:ubiquinone/menaquinone biosynthesis C-methylase UbiE